MKSYAQIDCLVGKLTCQVSNLTTAVATGTAPTTYVQAAPSGTWNLTHSFPYLPDVYVVDSSGAKIYPDVTYVDATHITVTANPPISGTVYMK